MQTWIFQAIMVFFAVIQVIILIAIKLNDIKHIDRVISEMKHQLNEIQNKLLDHEKRLSRIEGKLNNE